MQLRATSRHPPRRSSPVTWQLALALCLGVGASSKPWATDYEAQASRRVLCGDRGRRNAFSCYSAGHSGVDHPYHHGSNCRSGLSSACQCRSVGCGCEHFRGLDFDHSCQWLGCITGLLTEQSTFLSAIRNIAVTLMNH